MNPFISTDGRLRNGWRFLIAVALFIFTEPLARKIAIAITHSQGMGFEAVYRPLHLVLLLIAYSGMVRLFDRVCRGGLAEQGLNTRLPWLKDIAIGLGIGFALVTLGVIAIAVFGNLETRFEISGRTIPPGLLVLWTLTAAAMLEEVVFRGYPFQRLVDGLSAVDNAIHLPYGSSAIAVLSLLFGAVHLHNPHATWLGAVNTVLIGVLFSIAYLRTRGLWLPFGIHLGWNATLGLLYGLPVSGLTAFSVIVQSRASGPEWLTGADYGLEASATGTAIILLGIALIVKLVPNRADAELSSETLASAAGLASNIEGVQQPPDA
ncbi:MAG: protease, amino terminal family [Acidobacteriales bacterium]|nr:protease, amino terminal family [Terriglobales bacterium]